MKTGADDWKIDIVRRHTSYNIRPKGGQAVVGFRRDPDAGGKESGVLNRGENRLRIGRFIANRIHQAGSAPRISRGWSRLDCLPCLCIGEQELKNSRLESGFRRSSAS